MNEQKEMATRPLEPGEQPKDARATAINDLCKQHGLDPRPKSSTTNPVLQMAKEVKEVKTTDELYDLLISGAWVCVWATRLNSGEVLYLLVRTI